MDCNATSAGVESLRATLHAAVDALLARLLPLLAEVTPTLEGLEQSVLRELHTLGNLTLSGLCTALAPRYPAASVPCACGAEAPYVRQRTAQCKTLLGLIQLKRAYYLCAACHQGHCPLDRSLGLCAGGISGGLEALLALLGTELSYGHAAELVARLSLVTVSASRCRTATLAVGECLAQQEEQVRDTVWEQGQEPPPAASAQSGAAALDPLYVSADGVIVLTRETGWREQCVGAVYTAAPAPRIAATPHSHRPQRSRGHSFVSELGSRPAFSQLLWLEAHRRGLERAERLVFIGDGAQWLWQMATELFPTAIQILDWYHATSYVWRTAQALYPTQEAERSRWAEPLLTALWQSQTADVIARLAPLAADCTPAREALHYFSGNHSRMDYARYRSLGLQVGSGTIESACKHLIQARIKQAGMRWCVRNARIMGKLRARLKSNRWEETLALRSPLRRAYLRRTAT